jgi:hypothetical protein
METKEDSEPKSKDKDFGGFKTMDDFSKVISYLPCRFVYKNIILIISFILGRHEANFGSDKSGQCTSIRINERFIHITCIVHECHEST